MNRRIFKVSILTIVALTISACTPSTPPKIDTPPNQALVQSYANAYNANDLETMAAKMHDDIEWINIEGSSQTIITDGKEALVAELGSHFSSSPISSSTLSDWSVNGKYVSVKETVSFKRKDGTTGSQASLSVYELEDGLIRRVWYFPAE